MRTRFVSATLSSLVTAAVLAAHTSRLGLNAYAATESDQNSAGRWAAVAPAEIQPRSGFIRLSATVPGRLAAIHVAVGSTVKKGDLLAEIDNADLKARVEAAEAEVRFRQAERDNALVKSGSPERQKLEDEVEAQEALVLAARNALDALKTNDEERAKKADARDRFTAEVQRLDSIRNALAVMVAAEKSSAPTRTESALSLARAERQQALSHLEKSRVRAPIDGTVLDITRRLGETSEPAADDYLLVLGDIAILRLTAEVPARDFANVYEGQEVIFRTRGANDETSSGRVKTISKMLKPAKLIARPNGNQPDESILEVVAEIQMTSSLILGQQGDAYFVANESGDPNALGLSINP